MRSLPPGRTLPPPASAARSGLPPTASRIPEAGSSTWKSLSTGISSTAASRHRPAATAGTEPFRLGAAHAPAATRASAAPAFRKSLRIMSSRTWTTPWRTARPPGAGEEEREPEAMPGASSDIATNAAEAAAGIRQIFLPERRRASRPRPEASASEEVVRNAAIWGALSFLNTGATA